MRGGVQVRVLLAGGLAVLGLACGNGGGSGVGGQGGDAGPGAAETPSATDSLSAGRQAGASDLPADSLEVRVGAFLLRWVEATETRDTAALRDLYVDDGRLAWLEDGELRYRSVDQVLAGLAALGPGTSVRTVLGEVEAVPAGAGGVHAWTPFTTSVGQGEGRFTFGGILSMTLEPDGSGWRIVGGHTSSAAGR